MEQILTANPTSKEAFTDLAKSVMTLLARHTSHPLYATFVEALSKDLCEPLTAVQTRKVSSAVTVIGNTKQQDERDKASGKKKVGWEDEDFADLADSGETQAVRGKEHEGPVIRCA